MNRNLALGAKHFKTCLQQVEAEVRTHSEEEDQAAFYKPLVQLVTDALQRFASSTSAEYREGFARALADVMFNHSDGSSVDVGTWDPIGSTGGDGYKVRPNHAADDAEEPGWRQQYARSAACDISQLACALQGLLQNAEDVTALNLAIRIEELSSVVMARDDEVVKDEWEAEAFRLIHGPEAARVRMQNGGAA